MCPQAGRSFLSRDATELVSISGDVITGEVSECRFEIPLACPEARVQFKNIDFRTEADFASYCSLIYLQRKFEKR